MVYMEPGEESTEIFKGSNVTRVKLNRNMRERKKKKTKVGRRWNGVDGGREGGKGSAHVEL